MCKKWPNLTFEGCTSWPQTRMGDQDLPPNHPPSLCTDITSHLWWDLHPFIHPCIHTSTILLSFVLLAQVSEKDVPSDAFLIHILPFNLPAIHQSLKGIRSIASVQIQFDPTCLYDPTHPYPKYQESLLLLGPVHLLLPPWIHSFGIPTIPYPVSCTSQHSQQLVWLSASPQLKLGFI